MTKTAGVKVQAISTIGIVGILVYCNSLFGAFVWDDKAQIVEAPLLNLFTNIPFIFTSHNLSIFYRPMFIVVLTMLHFMFGQYVVFYHGIQLILHITATILVFLLLGKFISEKLSFLLAMVFLVHPINTEAVVYISAISDPIFVVFGLLSLALIMNGTKTWRICAASLLLLLTLLTKEAGIIFIFIIAMYMFLNKKDVRISMIRKVGILLIPLCVYVVLRFALAHKGFNMLDYSVMAQAGLYERITSIPKILFFYFSTVVLPWKLSIAQQWIVHNATTYDFYVPLLIDLCFIVLMGIATIIVYKKRRAHFVPLILFECWFVAAMGIYMQLIPLDMTVAERWFYLPMIGLLGMIGIIIQSLKQSGIQARVIGYAIMGLLLLLLSARTMARNLNWYTPITLYEHDSKVSDSFAVENLLGGEYFASEKYTDALQHYKKSVDLFANETNVYNLANTYFTLNNLAMAETYYKKAIEKNQSMQEVTYNPLDYRSYSYAGLAKVLLFTQREAVAKQIVNEGLNQNRSSAVLWMMEALVSYKLGNQEEAVAAAKKAWELNLNTGTEYIYKQIQTKKVIELPSYNGVVYRINP